MTRVLGTDYPLFTIFSKLSYMDLVRRFSLPVITTSFFLLVFVTPFIFFTGTYELFEWNKMIWVYLLTIVVTTAWVLRMIEAKKCLVTPTPLDLPIALYLLANILSTAFSIDPHVSIFGVYTRLNGGLLSTISYILLYYAFVSAFPREKIKQLLGSLVLAAGLVSIWGILEHFGIDPSCKIIADSWAADCWVQEVQERVFATLGQPNWLASYLSMVLPLSVGLMVYEKSWQLKTFYLGSSLLIFLSFIFTFSRGGSLGLVSGIVFFSLLLLVGKKEIGLPKLPGSGRFITILLALVTLSLLVFGSAFTKPLSFPFSKQAPTSDSQPTSAPQTTQLEAGGTESGEIRLIVWKGAVTIWKANLLFGSGVETFQDAYYQHRPVEHNLTTEWDFVYNKAHNEYLNLLSTTGTLGLLSYLFFIAAYFFYLFKKFWTTNPSYRILVIGLGSGVVTYLVSNFFSFSVVTTALFFFLYPALTFKLLETEPMTTTWFHRLLSYLKKPFSRLPFGRNQGVLTPILAVLTVVVSGLLLLGLGRIYLADLRFARAIEEQGDGSWQTAKYFLEQAQSLNPLEPLYYSELGYTNAVLAIQAPTDSESVAFAQAADEAGTKAVLISPYSVGYLRSLFRTYIELMDYFEGYDLKALEVAEITSELAPTDPKVLYNLASLSQQMGDYEKAIMVSKKITEIKPDYREAYLTLARSYDANNQRDEAIKVYRDMRVKFPAETEAPLKLKEWTGKED
jgi:putative inorganic carbon (HCO3(-)) transporter